jgi:hypothetical protein
MKYLYFILATLMLLCLAPMPYGYYTFIRFVAMVAFGVMAYMYYQKEEKAWAVTFGALAVLFQPLVKIALGRTMWNVVDVAVAVLLVICFFREKARG